MNQRRIALMVGISFYPKQHYGILAPEMLC